jgi:hypothetical protein
MGEAEVIAPKYHVLDAQGRGVMDKLRGCDERCWPTCMYVLRKDDGSSSQKPSKFWSRLNIQETPTTPPPLDDIYAFEP